jgi:cytochrome c5
MGMKTRERKKMDSRRRTNCCILLSVVSFFSLISPSLFAPSLRAMPKFMDRYDADAYARAEYKGRCTVCHLNAEGAGALNKIGAAFAKNDYRITEAFRKEAAEIFTATPGENARPPQKFDVKAFYGKNCSVCHGADGKGGEGDQRFQIVPDFTDAAWHRRRSNEKLMTAISNGKAGMPAFKDKLSDEQIRAMTAYVRAFADTK